MLARLVSFIVGREPVATASGLAALVTAALGAAAAFGLDITPEQIAAVGALAAAVAGYLGRRAVTPVLTPERPTGETGGVPLALIILVALGVVLLAGLGFCGDALFEDEDEVNDVGMELSSHDYCTADHDGCGYEDERGRNGRDKRTCFFGCDNIIVVPNPLDPGGGDGSEQPRTAHA